MYMSKVPSISYSTLEQSGMPSGLKSQMRSWIDRTITAGGNTPESARSIAKLHAVAAVEGVRTTGEAAVFGAVLGAVHGLMPHGLDMAVPNAKVNVPLDGVGALVGLAASVFAAQEPYGMGRTLAQGGASCATVFAFRKTNDLMAAMAFKKAGVNPNSGVAVGTARPIGKAATFAGEAVTGVFGNEMDAVALAARNL